jgi:phosphoglycerol transferase
VGLIDQASLFAVPSYAKEKRAYASDADIVRRIEAALPQGAAVFELPYMSFPETPTIHHLSSYGLIRPYLHSRALRWSYGAMRGRGSDEFARDLSAREPNKILETLAIAGFGAILIDRDGYVDAGSAIETAFRAALGAEPWASEDGRLSFFSLTDYRRRMHAEPASAEVDAILHPLTFTFASGFYGLEVEANRTFRWCNSIGEILIVNGTPLPRKVSVKMTLGAAQPPARLAVGGDLLSTGIDLMGPVAFDREIDVPPGHHVVRFSCDGRRANAPADPRTMIWQIESFFFEELPPSSAQAR